MLYTIITLNKSGIHTSIFSHFSTNTYFMGIHENSLMEVLFIIVQNTYFVCFRGEE